MIPSLDTYVYNKVKETLDLILENKHILKQTLANLDEKARDNFITAYGGEHPNQSVSVTYSYPTKAVDSKANVIIQLGKSRQTDGSIGNVEGTFNYRKNGVHQEEAVIDAHPTDDSRLAIQVSKTIGEVHSYNNISFSTSDDVQVENNLISFKKVYNEDLVGMKVEVTYTAKVDTTDGEDPKGANIGMTSTDVIQITPMSTNMDTIRCLDAIMKTVLIMMTQTVEENVSYQLQNLGFGEMGQMAFQDDPTQVIYSRPMTVAYVVENSIDYDYAQYIKEFIFKNRGL